MALSIGELTGYLDLDAGPFDKAIGKAFDGMGSKKWQVAGAAAGVAAGTALAAGLVSAANTEKLNAKLSASLGLTKDQSATAGTAAGKLYADNYGGSMEDVTGAVEGVMSSIKGMRTASSSDIQDVTKDVLNLGAAFEVDVGQTSQIVGQMITSGIATDAKNATDLLAVTLSKVPKNVRQDILDAVDEYGPFMASLGYSGEQAMGMLAKASEKGMYGIDKTGDALKEFTIRATDMSAASGIAYKTLGMDQEKMTNALLAGGDAASYAYGDIVSGLSAIKDPAEQSQAALALFGTPLEDLSVSEIPKFLESMNFADGALTDVAGKAGELDTTLSEGTANSFTTLQRSAETAMAAIGEKMLPILTPIIEKMTEWAPILGPLILGLAGFAAIMWVVNAAMLANPITWIILGIVALIAIIVLLVMNWDAVVAFLTKIWKDYIGWFVGVLNGFGNWWNEIWGGLGNFIKEVWDGFVKWISDVWNGFIGFIVGGLNLIKAYWNMAWSWVLAKVNEIWDGISKGVSDGIDGVVGFVRDLPGKVMGFFIGAGSWLIDAGKNILSGFLKGLQDGFEGVKDFVGGIGDWIAKNKGPKAYDLALLVPAGGWIMDGLGAGIQKSIPGLQKILSGVSATIATGVTGGTVGLAGVPSGFASTAATPTGPASVTNNWHLYEQSDPAATAMNVARRQAALGA